MSAGSLRELLGGDPVEVAPFLLGKLLVAGAAGGRIVEVEAYRGAADPASHAYRGLTARNRSMFGAPGLAYVYLSYGLHHCCNIVCWPEGTAGAVLVRALAPATGLAEMRARRPASQLEEDLCSGPGKLCQALGIDRRHDGEDLLAETSPVRLLDDGFEVHDVRRGPRIGLGSHLASAGEPWRYFVPSDLNVSRRRSTAQPLPASRSTTS